MFHLFINVRNEITKLGVIEFHLQVAGTAGARPEHAGGSDPEPGAAGAPHPRGAQDPHGRQGQGVRR